MKVPAHASLIMEIHFVKTGEERYVNIYLFFIIVGVNAKGDGEEDDQADVCNKSGKDQTPVFT